MCVQELSLIYSHRIHHVYYVYLVCVQGNGRLKVYDLESKCFESDIKITESKYGRSVRLVSRCFLSVINKAFKVLLIQY